MWPVARERVTGTGGSGGGTQSQEGGHSVAAAQDMPGPTPRGGAGTEPHQPQLHPSGNPGIAELDRQAGAVLPQSGCIMHSPARTPDLVLSPAKLAAVTP